MYLEKAGVNVLDKKLKCFQVFGELLIDVEINESNVMTVINTLSPSKFQGPDQLHPCLLKETKHQLKNPSVVQEIYRGSSNS